MKPIVGEHLFNDNAGYCSNCNKVIEGCCLEPDAENCQCPMCLGNNLMGLEIALLYDLIIIESGD